MTSTVESTGILDDPPPSRPTGRAPAPRAWSPWRPLLLRLHFYAGVFVAPFLVVAAVTGLGFVFTPQLDDVIYGSQLHTDPGGPTVGLQRQVDAARAAHPEGTIAEIDPAPGPGDTTRVVLSLPDLGERNRTVFVDPHTGRVAGTLTTWFGETPVTTWLDDLHRNLHLGDFGRLYSETAASWLWVIALAGLLLWWQDLRRRRGRSLLRRALLPDPRARGVGRTRSWHAPTGVWIAVWLLFLSATGLTWSHYAGKNFDAALTAMQAHKPDLPAATTTDPLAAPSGTGTALDADLLMSVANQHGLTHNLSLTPPGDEQPGWVVAENDRSWPVHYDRIVVEAATGQVTGTSRWADWPLLSQLSKLGVQAHMGYLFGLANQLLLTLTALALLATIFWGYRMWWQRRPTRTVRTLGRAPTRGTWRHLPPLGLLAVVLVTAAVAWALPVLGVTLAAFLLLDAAAALIRRRTRPATRPDDHPAMTR